MIRSLSLAAASAAALLLPGAQAFAQSECSPGRGSCTQRYEACQKACGNVPNQGRCISNSCSTPYAQCKSTGMWRSPANQSCNIYKDKS